MNLSRRAPFHLFFGAAVLLTLLPVARAQFELKSSSLNLLFQAGVPGTPSAVYPQFAGVQPTAAGIGMTTPVITLASVSVAAQGSGYTSTPTATIAGGGGSSATATVQIFGGKVTGVTLTNAGSGYTALPTLTISGGGGTGAVAIIGVASAAVAPTFPTQTYLANGTGAPTGVLLVHLRGRFGYAFAGGVPRYQMGETIVRPSTTDGGVNVADSSYWRTLPVTPGEVFAQPGEAAASAGTPVRLLSIAITAQGTGYTSAPTVTFSGGGGSGATAVPQISGGRVTTITLSSAGGSYTSTPAVTLTGGGGSGATATVTSEALVPGGTALNYYYSIHAERVFASQPGRVAITWVTRVPVTSADEPAVARYRFRQETFAVSSSTIKPPRPMYWTERTFSGPRVKIPIGTIQTVNPIYHLAGFPSAVTVGYVDPGDSSSLAPELKTLWFENQGGLAALHAYNVEGRILVEYLGALKPGSPDARIFLGADIIEVTRTVPTVNAVVELGQKITPRDSLGRQLPLDGNSEWLASPVQNLTDTSALPLYGSTLRADGLTDYYAERENNNPDKEVFNWLEKSDATIFFLDPPAAPNLSLYWPRHQNSYTQKWPENLASYAHNTVSAIGSVGTTAMQFPAGQLPQLIYQDDNGQKEAVINPSNQRLEVIFSGDGLNRSLLKFTNGTSVWYLPVYTQAETRGIAVTVTNGGSGYTAAPTVSFSAPATGLAAVATVAGGKVTGITVTDPLGNLTPSIMVTLSGGGGSGATAVVDTGFQDGDGLTQVPMSATVGSRIESPEGYATAGHIAGGTGYHPGAYLDPLVTGVPAAGSGAIIPVNAVPGDNVLRIWWFKKILPPSAAFEPIYVPAKLSRYTVFYPASADLIVLASNRGSGDLTPAEIAGGLYVQNDRTKPGFNPNEEHALTLNGRAWVLRDDLNDVSSTAANYTSAPFVLVSYTSSGDGRPAMHVFKVVRERLLPDSADDEVFNYPVAAGTILQAPMPLPLLPLPVDPVTRAVKNVELADNTDPAPSMGTPATYGKFTFQDRKGYDWVYRGPHQPGFRLASVKTYYGGSLYTSVPTVTFKGGGGSGATAVATLTGGRISAVTLVNPGSGYTTAPTVVFVGGGATNATTAMAVALLVRPQLRMQFYYPMRDGFYVPRATTQPVAGTPLPYLRPIQGGVPVGDPVAGTPLTIVYTPEWPDIAPELRVAETLTKPKFGLPEVLTQTSAEVLYQQSIAVRGATKPSVTLHDPIREKVFALGGTGKLQKLPDSVLVTQSQGKTYFQRLPPHLQSRFYFDPLRGPNAADGTIKGSLVLVGRFHDEIAGEDFVDLNVLSTDDLARLTALSTDAGSLWAEAIAALTTEVKTYKPEPGKTGSFIVDSTKPFGAQVLATIDSSDAAVANYAVTATGQDSGWVTMIFGNGAAFTPAEDPVSVQLFRVVPRLYEGDLKTVESANPLDEQVSLRHSGDFAAKPDDYDFEWRHAPPQDGKAPPIYSYPMVSRLSSDWQLVQSPKSPLPTTAEYAGALPVTLPRTVEVNALLDSVSVSSGGTGYQTVPTVKFVGGGGSGAAATASISAAGAVTAIKLTNRGAGYVVLPTVTLEGGGGSGAIAVANAAASFTEATARPGLAVRSVNGVDFTAGIPAQIVFSAELGLHTGFVLYVNGVVALAHNAPASFANTPPTAGLADGALSRQFVVSRNYFQQGVNRIEVALYSTADFGALVGIDFRLHGSTEEDLVAAIGSPWTLLTGLTNAAVVGGSPQAPLGSPLLVMSDNYFTVRYRPKAAANSVAGTSPSRWTEPKLVEGWIKRVLKGINPFNQRMSDLVNNAVNTDVSLLTQAGKRWEGNIALNLDNINDAGLIETYETVLNRGKTMSIDAGYDYGGTNDALLLAAGYLSDLYTILGNEAYADAANPTISIDDSTTATEVNTSRFSFEGQVKSVLEEELGLLRGRDDFLSPSVTVAPAYNRLYWNYTRGINSGEALYAVNYNIREKAGSSTADGVVNAADAQRMFPQGHGDAYGHYLTALTGYYRLLTNPHFTWTPRAEAVTVLGQAVTVDFFDERKFAEAAANVARTAQQIMTLTHRQKYQDDPTAGWSHLRDGKFNPSTGATRRWGLDEWASRSTQGAYYHWMVGNALLPEKDTDPNHAGVQIIDRTTVPALRELAAASDVFQATMDSANAHLNPLGLSPGAIAFDISPSELKAGHSHYEQIHDRALRAVLNAKGAFDQAAKMTRLLRNQEGQADDYNELIVDQETTYNRRLIQIYGAPYAGDIGPGKTYAQGYEGPDLINWYIVDRVSDLVDTSVPLTITVQVPLEAGQSPPLSVDSVRDLYYEKTVAKQISIFPNRLEKFSDDIAKSWGSLGLRRVVGTVQQAFLDLNRAQTALAGAQARMAGDIAAFQSRGHLYDEMIDMERKVALTKVSAFALLTGLRAAKTGYEISQQILLDQAQAASDVGLTLSESFPKSVGLASDTTSAARAAVIRGADTLAYAFRSVARAADASARIASGLIDFTKEVRDDVTAVLQVDYAHEQIAYEYELQLRGILQANYEIVQLAMNVQVAAERVRNVMAEGEAVIVDRTTFRQRAAAVVQGYRTRDLTFRVFRNEALEQYRSLFDLASRYTYLSAKSYDYETGLLGSTDGQAVVNAVVAARSLGDLTGGVPQATVSTLGDAGLAGTMARMQADWSVAKGRLGINNPDQNGTLFSLRQELYRLLDDPSRTDDDAQWQQTLEQRIMSNVLSDPDVAAQCLNIKKADGSAVPGIVIPFRTAIQHGQNFFGLTLAEGDHAFSASNFATKIYSVGIVLPGYIGLDPYRPGSTAPVVSVSSTPNALSATPYVYLIPTGTDYMRAPPLGDTDTVRGWNVADQALPLPFNLGATAFSSTQFYSANGTLSETPWILRKHQAFRPVGDANFFYSSVPLEFTSSRLVGRSVWNGGWKLVIPAYMLLGNEQEGLNRFTATVKDIQLFLRTYSNAGN